jgi:uncharacterized repeat protein (TIGR03803 family)
MMKHLTRFVAALIAGSMLCTAQGQTFKVLHTFTGSASDGAMPWSSVTPIGSTLYGTTYYGGSTGNGTIYRVDTDGSDFSLVHSFNGGTGDGKTPTGGLVAIGSALYGATNQGGSSQWGTVFQIGAESGNFRILHSFSTDASNGKDPCSDLTCVGATLYSNTYSGGNADKGTIFKVETDGSGFSVLHPFNGGISDGATPYGGLTAIGSALYGVTTQGGSSNEGTIFRLNMDGSGFSLLHSFNGGAGDGAKPQTRLTLVGSTLYGLTDSGGSGNKGTIFRIATDGSDFSVLHSFNGGVNDGTNPVGGLTLLGSTLYGTTYYGGSSNEGTVFQIGADGMDYKLLHTFTDDGANPFGALTAIDSTLYGTTKYGGGRNMGVVFSIAVPEHSTLALLGMGVIGLSGYAWRRRKV